MPTDLPELELHHNANYIFWSFGINELLLLCFECSENTKTEQERESTDIIKNGHTSSLFWKHNSYMLYKDQNIKIHWQRKSVSDIDTQNLHLTKFDVYFIFRKRQIYIISESAHNIKTKSNFTNFS